MYHYDYISFLNTGTNEVSPTDSFRRNTITSPIQHLHEIPSRSRRCCLPKQRHRHHTCDGSDIDRELVKSESTYIRKHTQRQSLPAIKRHGYKPQYNEESKELGEGCPLLGGMNISATDLQMTEIWESFSVNLHRRCVGGWAGWPCNGSESTYYGLMGTMLHACGEGG
jgi:hypothetical protein